MLLFIKYTTLSFCAFYISQKIHNPNTRFKLLSSHCIILPLISLFISFVELHFPYCTILILVTFYSIYISHNLNLSLETTIYTTIISYGISFTSFILSSLITTSIIIILVPRAMYEQILIIIQLLAAIIHCFITFTFLRKKRLKKGLLQLINQVNDTTLMFISLLLLLLILILSNTGKNALFIILFFIVLTLIAFLAIYWRNAITRTYRDKLRDRDIDILTEHADELEEEYKKLAEDKDELAKIVHRDNKLVPAMLLSVESFLTEFPDATPEMKSRGQELMAELNKEAESRKGILKQQDQKCTAKLISTGIPYLDSVLTYMQEKAMSKDIVLSASGDPGIADLVARTIEEEDLKTLAADMLENAIIANTYNHGSNVYFVIGYFGKHLAIYVYDSGIPFTKEVLLDLGIQKHTTHEADGGSGIGLMTIFELVRKYRATYIIDEYSTPTGPYTKRITIVFDKRRKYILNTSRPKEEIDFLRQRADLIIESRKEPHIK